ncbi:MAG: riboflavin biosynthesis protein RibF [Candidatus Omnitrophica bacterium]|nr:riboflavin biosynthesis protein RibF [Candidatus Omnitrophota bacterium]
MKRPVAAIGIFDGVHRGHQAILRRAKARAGAVGGTAMAITFYPHPAAVLAPGREPPLLLSLAKRLEAFASLGIGTVLVIPFTRSFSRWPPRRFVQRLLVDRLKVREVVVGHDFGFGHGRSGSVDTLRQLGREFGFKVHAVPPVKVTGERISSRRIRELIRQGSLSKAARFLGRPVSVEGRVIRGTGRGRRIGFPTANVKVEAGVLPPTGVYAVAARIGRRRYSGMANLGLRPTFNRGTLHKGTVHSARGVSLNGASPLLPLLEVHLFDLHRSLYGRRLEVAFLKRLRPERRFRSAEALARQLSLDAIRAKRGFRFTGRGPGGRVVEWKPR